MRTCKRCKEVKFWFQFTSESMGYFTAVYDVCRKCTKELGVIAAANYREEAK